MHPDNPCQFEPREAIAAKTWELLRRNEQFRKDAGRYFNWAKSPQPKPRQSALDFVHQLEDGERANPFALEVLRWLVPDPLFRRTLPKCVAGVNDKGQPVKLDKVWEGRTPDMPTLDDPGWRVMNFERPGHRGAFTALGPVLEWTEGDPVDEILEWAEYHQTLGPSGRFLLDRPWRELPKPLQRAFQNELQNRLLRQTNPLSGRRDFDRPGVVRWFDRDWLTLLTASRRELLPRLWELQNLADNNVLFTFPKGKFLSKGEITDILAKWKAEIEGANSLRPRNVTLLGTPDAWDYFLHNQSCELKEAHFRIYKEKGHDEAGAFERFHRDRKQYEGYVEAIRSLIRLVYPVFSFPD